MGYDPTKTIVIAGTLMRALRVCEELGIPKMCSRSVNTMIGCQGWSVYIDYNSIRSDDLERIEQILAPGFHFYL